MGAPGRCTGACHRRRPPHCFQCGVLVGTGQRSPSSAQRSPPTVTAQRCDCGATISVVALSARSFFAKALPVLNVPRGQLQWTRVNRRVQTQNEYILSWKAVDRRRHGDAASFQNGLCFRFSSRHGRYTIAYRWVGVNRERGVSVETDDQQQRPALSKQYRVFAGLHSSTFQAQRKHLLWEIIHSTDR